MRMETYKTRTLLFKELIELEEWKIKVHHFQIEVI
ncbi:MAG: hypothetical protein ACJAU0_000127 [Flavobacteriales bacterium]|jgi:hypothetical protein